MTAILTASQALSLKLASLREIRKEKKYIIDLAFQVLRSTLEDPSIDAVKRAELGLRFLGKIGFDTTLQYSLLNLDDTHL